MPRRAARGPGRGRAARRRGDVEADEGAPPDRAAAGKSYLPSSLGVSVLVAPGVEVLEARVLWGDYEFEGAAEASPAPGDNAPVPGDPQSVGAGGATPRPLRGHRRLPREETVALALPAADAPPLWLDVPSSRGLTLVVTCRALPPGPSLPAGVRSVSVFLVNNRRADADHAYRSFVFQAGLVLRSPAPFVPRPDLRYFDPLVLITVLSSPTSVPVPAVD